MSLIAGVMLAASAQAVASGVPLTLSYSVTPEAGQYRYQFRLTMDNHDGSWVPGQGWGWIIYGDRYYATSLIDDFVGNPSDLPIGPWNEFTRSEGEHNGPTLGYILTMWIPTFVGESVSWSGRSSGFIPPGGMKWSALFSTGGAMPVFFEPGFEGGGGCPSDFDHDGFVTGDDFDGYVAAFEAGDISSDFDRDGFVTGDDFDRYVVAFEGGC